MNAVQYVAFQDELEKIARKKKRRKKKLHAYRGSGVWYREKPSRLFGPALGSVLGSLTAGMIPINRLKKSHLAQALIAASGSLAGHLLVSRKRKK